MLQSFLFGTEIRSRSQSLGLLTNGERPFYGSRVVLALSGGSGPTLLFKAGIPSRSLSLGLLMRAHEHLARPWRHTAQ